MYILYFNYAFYIDIKNNCSAIVNVPHLKMAMYSRNM
jgi:hypothetical protein